MPLNGNFNFKTKMRKLFPIFVSKGKSRTENKKNAFFNSKFDLLVKANSVLLNKFLLLLDTCFIR